MTLRGTTTAVPIDGRASAPETYRQRSRSACGAHLHVRAPSKTATSVARVLPRGERSGSADAPTAGRRVHDVKAHHPIRNPPSGFCTHGVPRSTNRTASGAGRRAQRRDPATTNDFAPARCGVGCTASAHSVHPPRLDHRATHPSLCARRRRDASLECRSPPAVDAPSTKAYPVPGHLTEPRDPPRRCRTHLTPTKEP